MRAQNPKKCRPERPSLAAFIALDAADGAARLPASFSKVAQLVEQATVNRRVPGSSPGFGAQDHEDAVGHAAVDGRRVRR